jgi:hypothetical protein
MTTKLELIEYLERNQQAPVLASRRASLQSRRRILADKMRLQQLPIESIILYVIGGAASETPNRLEANEQFEREGFLSYRQLLPILRGRFADVWP